MAYRNRFQRVGLGDGPWDNRGWDPPDNCRSMEHYNDAYNAYYAVLYSGHTAAQATDAMWKVRCGILTYAQALTQFGGQTPTQASMQSWQAQNTVSYKPIDYSKAATTSTASGTGAGATAGSQAPAGSQPPKDSPPPTDPPSGSWFSQSMFGGFPNWALLALAGGGGLLFFGGRH